MTPSSRAGSAPAPAWFRDPAADFWPSAYWFWHRQPTAPELRRQVAEIAAAGFRTLLIQPRLAFPRERYLDDAYLDAYRAGVECAREAGLKVGIYDDYNWMTGHGAGRTVAGRDDLRERHLFWSSAAGEGGTATCRISKVGSDFLSGLGTAGRAWYYEDSRPVWTGWTVVAAVAYPAGGVADPAEIVDVAAAARITETSTDGCRVVVDGLPAGHEVTVFVAARCATSRLINYLMPEAADRFVETCYQPYFDRLGDLFGDPILYMFFDHPHAGFYGWAEHAGDVGNSLMYAEGLPARIAADHGRPFGAALLALVRPIGPATAAWRCDFFASYAALAHGSFLGRLSDWARAHGVGLAGHEILTHVGGWGLNDGFSRIDPRATLGVDYFDVDRYRTHTTVDASNFNAQLSPKLGDSVARAHGRSRCIVEQYAVAVRPAGGVFAAGQWELTLDTLRAQAIRLHLLGARQFLFHAYYQTDGWDGDAEPFTNPRFDFAPGINFEPWFGHLPAFSRMSARLSAFMEGVVPATEIAVLYPLSTAWAEGPRHAHGAHAGAWCRHLAELGIGFQLVDERDLERATVADGRLVLDGLGYRAVVFPGMTVLRSARTLDQAEALVAAGGTAIASGPLPRTVHKGSAAGLARRAGQLFAGPRHLAGLPDRETVAAVADPGAAEAPRARASAAGAPLWQWHGRAADGWRSVVFNDGPALREVAVALPAGFAEARRWRPEDGTIEPWPWQGDAAGRPAVNARLDPGELLCLAFGAGGDGRRLTACAGRVERFVATEADGLTAEIVLRPGDPGLVEVAAPACSAVTAQGAPLAVAAAAPGRWRVAVGPAAAAGAVTLDDGWTFRAGAAAPPVPIAVTRGWEEQGFAGFSGTGIYECRFDAPEGAGSGDLDLVLPSVHTAVRAALNGVPLGACGWAPYRLAVPASAWRAGANTLVLEVANTAANRYYAGTPYAGPVPDASGLKAPPRLEPVRRLAVRF